MICWSAALTGCAGNIHDVAGIYAGFLAGLHTTIHDGLDESDATSMLAQQLITRPVFDVLFEGYQFSQNNDFNGAEHGAGTVAGLWSRK